MSDGEPLSPDEVDALYALPLEEFMPARAALAGRLKDAGRRDAAAAATALRKPTVTAWTVNQLARRNPGELDDLFRANDRLRSSQTGGAEGGSRFREAVRARQDALARLAEAATGILAGAGHPESRATLDRVSVTLMATATDEPTGALVRRGVLARDVQPSADFGALGFAAAGASAGAEASSAELRDRGTKRSPRSERDAARSAERKALRDAEARAEGLVRRAEEAERIAGELEREAGSLARSAARARAEAERARRAATKARSRAAEAALGLRSISGSG